MQGPGRWGEEGRGEEAQGRPDLERKVRCSSLQPRDTQTHRPTSGLLPGGLHFNTVPGLG